MKHMHSPEGELATTGKLSPLKNLAKHEQRETNHHEKNKTRINQPTEQTVETGTC